MHWATIEKRITIVLFWKHKVTEHGFCCITGEKVMNGANASHVNAKLAADVLYMRVNPHVICKMESEFFFAVVENDMTLRPTERKKKCYLSFVCIYLDV